MEWSDTAIVLSTRPHGEAALLVILMTHDHGRHAGMARGQRLRQELQAGTLVAARWRARLNEHLGSYTLETTRSAAGRLFGRPDRLMALQSACALTELAVPERMPLPNIFDGLSALLEALEGPSWDAAYVKWELGLLAAVGFGLDLERCAATGANDDLVFVSPRTGRAVSASAGEPYADRLLPLPAFLVRTGTLPEPADIVAGLRLTGHFLARNLFGQANRPLPAARIRYFEDYSGRAPISGR